MLSDTLSRLKYRHPLYFQIAALFTLLIVIFGTVIIIFSYSQLTRLTESSTNQQYQKTGEAVATELDAVTRGMIMSVNLLAGTTIAEATSLEQRMRSVDKLIEILRQNNYASSVYLAWPNGDFFMLRRITPGNSRFFQVPDNVMWLVQSNRQVAGKSEKCLISFNEQLQIIGTNTTPDDPFDPRKRSWFIQASKNTGQIASQNYRFYSTGEMGLTYSRLADNRQTIIGLDVSLTSLSQFLKQQDLPVGSLAAIVNASGEMLASLPLLNDGETGFSHLERSPVLSTLSGITSEEAGKSIQFNVDDQSWYGSIVSMDSSGNHYRLIIATPSDLLTTDANAVRNNTTLIAFFLLLLSLPVIWYFSRRVSMPLIRLSKDAEAISNLTIIEDDYEHSAIEEVDNLHCAMAKMKNTLNQFISMGTILSAKDNFPQQIQGLLNEATKIASMNGGIIYQADKKMNIFTPIAVNRENNTWHPSDREEIQLTEQDMREFGQIHEGQSFCGVFDSQVDQPMPPAPLRAFLHPCHRISYIAVPMQTHDGDILGFLLLLNFQVMNTEQLLTKMHLVNALIGSMSLAIETQYLLQEQKNLLNAFIELIAGAIDAKSAYTGGHCQRVPEITKMLAQAAVDAKTEPFSSFSLSENEWEELHIASWLHDCGKITTPEFVVDKATKLELVYDRIHEIRMRFEVLKLEKENTSLRSRIPHSSLLEPDLQLEETLRQLDNDFYFIAQCNTGSEFLSDSALARIHEIAGYQWTRTLDDTAGVSRAELERKTRISARPLPVRESILADKEEHIVYRNSKGNPPDSYQFRIRQPDYLYNYGEIYNLSIRRGTLTEEERYKINEHIMQTIIMLKKLPFPRTMINVPVIAGGHHERMDGKGYPYKLREDQMSIPVRILAIADVFEALTAADRPYKPGKRLTEALDIMVTMVNENHLNRDLFILFLQSGVWREYSTIFLPGANVAEVNVQNLLDKIESGAVI